MVLWHQSIECHCPLQTPIMLQSGHQHRFLDMAQQARKFAAHVRGICVADAISMQYCAGIALADLWPMTHVCAFCHHLYTPHE